MFIWFMSKSSGSNPCWLIKISTWFTSTAFSRCMYLMQHQHLCYTCSVLTYVLHIRFTLHMAGRLTRIKFPLIIPQILPFLVVPSNWLWMELSAKIAKMAVTSSLHVIFSPWFGAQFSQTYWKIELHCSTLDIIHKDCVKAGVLVGQRLFLYLLLWNYSVMLLCAHYGYVTRVKCNPKVFTLRLSTCVRFSTWIESSQPTSWEGLVLAWIENSARFSAVLKCCSVKRSVYVVHTHWICIQHKFFIVQKGLFTWMFAWAFVPIHTSL